MDIQHNPDWADELVDRVADVISGKLSSWERIGNAFRLELVGRRALIEDLVDEDTPPQEITLEDLSRAVSAWKETFSGEQ
jgi:hypothetical protein